MKPKQKLFTRKQLSQWEHFCRWFKTHGVYILIGVLTTINAYMYMERLELDAQYNSVIAEREKLRQEKREAMSDFVKMMTAKTNLEKSYQQSIDNNLELKKVNASLTDSLTNKIKTLELLERQKEVIKNQER